MIYHEGLIINPADHLKPTVRISPFNEGSLLKNKKNACAEEDPNIIRYVNNIFPNKNVRFTESGREAIGLALDFLELKSDDCVSIFTTTNNFYISGCVTKEIEKRCKWSREINSKTRAILVNHEFGVFSKDVYKYKEFGVPIIHDFAHSFFSLSEASELNSDKDFIVCSFSKIFPMQIGGCIISDYINPLLSKDVGLKYVVNNASCYVNDEEEIRAKRNENYALFCSIFASMGMNPFFNFCGNDVPSVFCFSTPESLDLPKLKMFMNGNGVESSIFYGANAYFLPCHQNMSFDEVNYVSDLVKFFMNNYAD